MKLYPCSSNDGISIFGSLSIYVREIFEFSWRLMRTAVYTGTFFLEIVHFVLYNFNFISLPLFINLVMRLSITPLTRTSVFYFILRHSV
jgi:hypothetical protein